IAGPDADSGLIGPGLFLKRVGVTLGHARGDETRAAIEQAGEIDHGRQSGADTSYARSGQAGEQSSHGNAYAELSRVADQRGRNAIDGEHGEDRLLESAASLGHAPAQIAHAKIHGGAGRYGEGDVVEGDR